MNKTKKIKPTIKICFISRAAYPLFNPKCKATFGGAEVDLFMIAKELAKDKRFSVNFLVGDFGQKDIENINNVKIFKSYKVKECKLAQMLKLIIKLIKIKSDIYFQESASGGTGVIRSATKLLRKKFIYRTASDIDCNGKFIENKFIEGFLFKLGIKYADVVITQNNANKKQLKKSIGVGSIVVKNSLKIKHFKNNNRKYILWIGRSNKLKQPYIFLDLAKKIPRENFVMICPPTAYNSIDLKKLKRQIVNLPNIKLINYVPFAEINEYFSTAKIFINTSEYEGFPNTFVQSVINATPIITLNIDPDNFMAKSGCGVCANGKVSKLISETKRILNSKEEWKKMSDKAYCYALDNHDIKVIINKYKSMFIKINK